MSGTSPSARPGGNHPPQVPVAQLAGRLVGLAVAMGLLYGLYVVLGDLAVLSVSYGGGDTWSTAFLVKAWKQLAGAAILEQLYLKGSLVGWAGFVFLLFACMGCLGGKSWGRMLFIIACLFLISGKLLGLSEVMIRAINQNQATMVFKQYLQLSLPMLPMVPWTWLVLMMVMSTRAAGEWFGRKDSASKPASAIPARFVTSPASSPVLPPGGGASVQFINPAMAAARVVAEHHPRGLGGWLVLPAFGIIVYSATVVIELLAVVYFMNHGKGAPPLVATVDAILALFILAFLCVAAGAFFGKRQNAPGLIILIAIFELFKRIIVGFMACNMSVPEIQQYGMWSFYIAGGDLLIAMIWIPYFSHSERVRNTFVS